VNIPVHNVSIPEPPYLIQLNLDVPRARGDELEVSMHPLNLLNTKIDLLERSFHGFYE
jgi:hypothetical protein